ncbi:AraC family transcriptional regulator [Paenibacillaceae bacterium]|nr:AraC family transcriptional regulator [Paenibacillaceae bacterium]
METQEKSKTKVILTKGEMFFRDDFPLYINRVYEWFDLPEHTHDFWEICYVWEGSGFHYIGNQVLRVKKGDLFLLETGVSHIFRPASQSTRNGLIVGNCIFNEQVLAMLSTGLSFPFKPFSLDRFRPGQQGWKQFQEKADEFADLFDKLYREYNERKQGYECMVYSLLLQLLLLLERQAATQLSSATDDLDSNHIPGLSNAYRTRLDDALSYITKHLSTPLTLSQLAAHMQLSDRQVQRLLRRFTGRTFTEMLQSQRMKQSRLLLQQTDFAIADIAPMVGYQDLKHFHRLFKSSTGMTPAQFRVKHLP